MAVYTVSEVTRFIKGMFDSEPILHNILIRGELSNYKVYPSGHAYFTLKDKDAAIKGVMFRSSNRGLKFKPENGMQVIISGNISVYEVDGLYQLYTESMLVEGIGELALAYEQLKSKLTTEGIFDSEHKKALPKYPKRIGIVTSQAGAVLRDIYKVSKRRYPAIQLILLPVQVQGNEAAGQIAKAIETFNEKYPVDVLIVGRGGGSIEDLWAFNEEIVVRAIFNSKIPIISAVGHETDTTLADYVADARAATPSQAAELAVPDMEELVIRIGKILSQLKSRTKHNLTTKRLYLEKSVNKNWRLKPQMLLVAYYQKLDRLNERFNQGGSSLRKDMRMKLENLVEKLDILNPVKVLYRGYSIVDKKGVTIKSVKDVKCGDDLTVTFTDGKRMVTVK